MPASSHLQWGETDTESHMRDIKIERTVEKTIAARDRSKIHLHITVPNLLCSTCEDPAILYHCKNKIAVLANYLVTVRLRDYPCCGNSKKWCL